MNTLYIKDEIEKAAELIKNGGLVAVPTETVYGLAANGLDIKAVEKIYEVKGRPPVKPLSLMVASAEAMAQYCEDVPQAAYKLAECYWPGPLTIVLKAKALVPELVRAGGSTVGLRCPNHPMTQRLIELAGLPLAAPSANPSGAESPKNAAKVKEYFDGLIDAVIDGGDCGLGVESTLIDMSRTPYKVLREAAVSEAELAAYLTDCMRIIGITGGSACGKTSALRELEKQGALVIDCDALYHEMLLTDAAMKSELLARFPQANKDGTVDRRALGGVVFKDSAALSDLNAITHRHIAAEVERRLRRHAMNGGSIAAVDAVELISSGLAVRCDALIAVSADRELRVHRIVQRDGISPEAARLRLDAQKSDDYYRENCDYVLMNNGNIADFLDEFKQLIQEVVNNG